MNNFAAIILAAGQSSRLGRPKQLVEFQGKKLLQHSIEAIKPIVGEQFIVVLGAHHQTILQAFEESSFPYILNPSWQEGMSSSLKKGLSQLVKNDSIDGIFLLVSDQPFVNSEVIKSLLYRHLKTKKSLIASQYAKTVGVPAFFHKTYFDELLNLNEEGGAKKLFSKYPDELALIDFPQGAVDIDTIGDLEKLPKG